MVWIRTQRELWLIALSANLILGRTGARESKTILARAFFFDKLRTRTEFFDRNGDAPVPDVYVDRDAQVSCLGQ